MSAYADALKLLARRELSEAQVRQRLARKGHTEPDIDQAVARLVADRSIDDARVADAIARTETAVRKRGRVRVRMRIQQAGIGKDIARQAVDQVFGGIDDDELIEAALRKRLRHRDAIADDREFQKLYRYLVAQGFEHDRVLRTLSRKRR